MRDGGPDLFSAAPGRRGHQPLAGRMRPTQLAEVVGQEHLTGPGKPLAVLVAALTGGERAQDAAVSAASVILWGPAGCGKTTLARLVAAESGAAWRQVSAVTSGVKDLREAIAQGRDARVMSGRRTCVFVDEIHRFSKAQQDVLLPAVEDGDVVLLAATTENPHFSILTPLLSRSLVLPIHRLGEESLRTLVARAVAAPQGLAGQVVVADQALAAIVDVAGHDARKALTVTEAAAAAALHSQGGASSLAGAGDDSARDDLLDVGQSGTDVLGGEGSSRAGDSGDVPVVTLDHVRAVAPTALVAYDRAGDGHYDTASALIKSIRGSDVDAALHYLAVMVHAGEDVAFVSRRLVIAAAEDIGTADPQGLVVAQAAAGAALSVGWPEARIVLAEAVVYLALAPKSNSVFAAIDAALADVRAGKGGPPPAALRDSHYKGAKTLGHGVGYRYAHDDPTGVVEQQYAPDDLVGVDYFAPTLRGAEGTWAPVLERLRARTRGY